MPRQNIIFNFGLFVFGGFVAVFLENLTFYSFYKDRQIFTRTWSAKDDLAPHIDLDKPRVFTHSGLSLQRVYGFCAMLPQMDCAMMKTSLGPIPVYIHHTKSSGVSGAIFKHGSHEPHIMNEIKRELEKHPDAGFIDIGSNIGPFTLHAAKLKRTVLAVDAVVDNVQRLCKSVEKNGFTELVTMVVNPMSDQHTSVSLEKGESETFEMTKVGARETTSKCGDSSKLKTVLLDDLISLAGFKIAIMKVDVEGFEYHVINGGKNFLKTINVPSIIMEWKHVKKVNGRELVNHLSDMNYVPHSFSDNGDHALLEKSRYQLWPVNMIWIKRSQ